MKKPYEKPAVSCEKFDATEYVAACYYGECNATGEVFIDNGDKVYNPRKDTYVYFHEACGEPHVLTGIDSLPDKNAFVVTFGGPGGDQGHGHDTAIPAWYFGDYHIYTSFRPHERPNHS